MKMAEHGIPLDILDDLSSRFIINVPEEERKDLVRICFQIELAHWFYLDFYCGDGNRKLRTCHMKEFSMHIFNHIPFLKVHISRLDTILEQWREYKMSVPTYGAIVLNEDLSKVLLVQNYWAKNSWGFPKGKVNENEDPSHCAVREVLEETGFDISNLIDKNEFIESMINDRVVRLYIITGVQRDTKFQPLTRKEIKSVEWFSLNDLPITAKDMTPKVKMGVGPNAFFMVVPFVRRMKRWVFERQQRERQALSATRRHRHKSLGDADSLTKNKKNQQQYSAAVTLQGGNTTGDTMKNQRQSNTSPVRNRRGLDHKSTPKTVADKNLSKAAFKRNLFGDSNDDKSTKSPTTILAKQLADSPRGGQSKKSTHKLIVENGVVNVDKNLQSTLFNDAVRKLATNLNGIRCSYSTNDYRDNNSYNGLCNKFEFQSRLWTQFKFDKQAILNCI